jgi:hypothetical protein
MRREQGVEADAQRVIVAAGPVKKRGAFRHGLGQRIGEQGFFFPGGSTHGRGGSLSDLQSSTLLKAKPRSGFANSPDTDARAPKDQILEQDVTVAESTGVKYPD